MIPRAFHLAAIVASVTLAAAVRADELPTFEPAPLGDPSITLDLSAAADQPSDKAPVPTRDPADPRPKGYGKAGSRWWTIGAAYANDFEDANDFNIHAAYSTFLTDELEFAVEAAAWYFNQPGDDTEGLSGSFLFRWHFLHPEDYKWTVFADAGIGLLASFDNVPDGGTGFNFLPRIGGGFTWALDDSIDGESRGARLMVGLRYHHISNGRIASDSHNPARDALMGYAAIVIPF